MRIWLSVGLGVVCGASYIGCDGGGYNANGTGQGGEGTKVQVGGSGGRRMKPVVDAGPDAAEGGSSGAGGMAILDAGAGGMVIVRDAGTGGRMQMDTAVVVPPGQVVPNPNATKLPFGPRARMVGGHNTACTNSVPAAGGPQTADRWCAYWTVSELLGNYELWVFNLTQAVRSPASVTCANPDETYCKRLTTNLWTGQPNSGPAHPFAHAFDGDTLLFNADAISAPDELYEGVIYAWRPGWSAARALTDQHGILCSGHPAAAVALCLTNIEKNLTLPFEYDLHAGLLADSPTSALPYIDRIHPLNSNDVSKWRASFSPAGDYFAYSAGRTDTDREVLRVIPAAQMTSGFQYNAAAVTPVLSDTAQFAFSQNGRRIFWLEQFNYSASGSPSGTLKVADFPGGANPATVMGAIGAFTVLGRDTVDAGLSVFANVSAGKGTLRTVADPRSPAVYRTIGTGVASALVSGDGRYTLISRNVSTATGNLDLYSATNANATMTTAPVPCAVQTALTTDAYGDPFLRSSGLIFYVDPVDNQRQVGRGMLARPDCGGKMVFASDIDFWFPVGDVGLIYSDDALVEFASATLRYARISNNVWPAAGGTVIQKGASRVYSMTLPDYRTVLYEIETGNLAVDGLYTFQTPF